MKFSRYCVLGAGVLGVLVLAQTANAEDKASAKAASHCKLINTKEKTGLYDGDCTIRQSVDKDTKETTWNITMGTDEPYLFSCLPDGQCKHGQDKAQYKDKGRGGTFHWGEFKLKIKQD